MTGAGYVHNYMRKQERTDLWRDFQGRFMQLAREEQGRVDAITNGAVLRYKDQVLRTTCNYTERPEGWVRGKPEQGCLCLLNTPPHGVWNYGNTGVSENFRERVRLCVAEAGRALPDYPNGTDAEDFWLHRLYLDLLKNDSDLLFGASEEGGMILSVCVASATFCARLRRADLSSAANSDKTAERAQSKATLESQNRGGRPRKDVERELVREKKAAGKTWKEIANELNAETRQGKTADAYRNLLRSNPKLPGKKGEN
jgi:hypothetical protein